jgi:hypothetical protein
MRQKINCTIGSVNRVPIACVWAVCGGVPLFSEFWPCEQHSTLSLHSVFCGESRRVEAFTYHLFMYDDPEVAARAA